MVETSSLACGIERKGLEGGRPSWHRYSIKSTRFKFLDSAVRDWGEKRVYLRALGRSHSFDVDLRGMYGGAYVEHTF